MPVVDAETVERELPFDRHDFRLEPTEWNSLLSDVLDRESDRVETWANTVFSDTQATTTLGRPEYVDERDLPLPKRPIQSVTSLEVGGNSLTDGADYTVEDTHLVLLDDADRTEWPTDRYAIGIEWTYGYSEPPGPVEDAVIRLARNALERINSDGLTQEGRPDGGNVSYRLPAELLADVRTSVREHTPPSYYSGSQVV